MEVVILAGGFGTRMRPLTYFRPKPLLPVLNKPLLAHILDRLPAKTSKVILPVGYLRDQIDEYFRDHPDPRIVLVEEGTPLGTGGAIKNCEDELSGTFIVYNGDVIASLKLDQLWTSHQRNRAEASISLWPVAEPWHFGVVELDGEHRITNFVEKPPQGREPSNLINAGHYVLNREVLDAIPAGRTFSIERELFTPWSHTNHRIFGFPFEGYWIDCGRPESVLEAHATLLQEMGREKVVASSAKVSKSAKVLGYAVDERCTIGDGARVERSVLFPDVSLAKGVSIIDSVLGEGVVVEDGARLERCVVGDHGIIAAGARAQDQRIGLRPVDLEA